MKLLQKLRERWHRDILNQKQIATYTISYASYTKAVNDALISQGFSTEKSRYYELHKLLRLKTLKNIELIRIGGGYKRWICVRGKSFGEENCILDWYRFKCSLG